ncbi:hypothetical protein [Streptomyces coffeae]|uniref:AMP-dependent synthetase/ligase domain-containing protein n=1 Tax=Streptomyces coffeae TaxID=621382 RepID=A0ABS1NNR9_9ACTN|nr:hypothetical protein [Streptomyces coffeae]MBL1101500.1 hypothetical protein [Streptomyces coffeae]
MTVHDADPWLARYGPGQQATITPEHNDILTAFRATVKRTPEADAIRYFDGRISFRELDGLTDAFAAGIADAGFSPGERVAILPAHPKARAATTSFCPRWRTFLTRPEPTRRAQVERHLDHAHVGWIGPWGMGTRSPTGSTALSCLSSTTITPGSSWTTTSPSRSRPRDRPYPERR